MNDLRETIETIKYFMLSNMSFLIHFPIGFIFGATFIYFCLDWS